MAERLQQGQEQGNAERLKENATELQEQLKEHREREARAHERDAENAAEKAREDIERLEKRQEKAEKAPELSPAEKRKTKLADRTRFDTNTSFKKVMTPVQSQMSGPSRAFSKFIHARPIEKASEVVGNTVARPNALLSGAIFAFLFTVGIYLWAKNAGYPLSGFETIAAFIIGYLVGIILDFIRITITGKD